MKKDVRGLVENNKGNCKRVYEIEFNHECEIKIVTKDWGYIVFQIENKKNEMVKIILFPKKSKNALNTLNNLMNGKDNKTYILTCHPELFRDKFGKKHDNNEFKNIDVKKENEVIEEKKEIIETKTNSPICNKAIRGIEKGYGDLGNNKDRLIEKRANLDTTKEEKEKELRGDEEELEEVKEEKKNIKTKLDEAINIHNDEDEAYRLLGKYFKKLREEEEINKSITEKKNQIINISTKMGILTKKIQRIQRLIDEANSVALSD